MSKLNLAPNLSRHDDIYAELMALHEGLSEAEALKVNAKLVLMLTNHIGDADVVREAIALARPKTAG